MNELKPEDVMRALERCSGERCGEKCPCYDMSPCEVYLAQNALALLREKDAEIERLYKNLNETAKEQYINGRTNGITEFAESIKSLQDPNNPWDTFQVSEDQIAQIAKSLKEEFNEANDN
jgi:hypothetical protein